MKVLVPCLLSLVLLAACSAPSTYRPYSEESGGSGYSEVNIAKNRYEVFYHGSTGMDDAAAKRLAIVRAAEIGRQNGFAWLRIAGSKIRRETVRETPETDLFPEHPWTGESLTRAEREQRAWEESRRRRQRAEAAKNSRDLVPVVQLTVQYRDGDCDDCLSVEAKLREAIEQGILGSNDKIAPDAKKSRED